MLQHRAASLSIGIGCGGGDAGQSRQPRCRLLLLFLATSHYLRLASALLVRDVVGARCLGSVDVCDLRGRVASESVTGDCDFCATAKLRGDGVSDCVCGRYSAYDLTDDHQLDLFSQCPAQAVVTSIVLY